MYLEEQKQQQPSCILYYFLCFEEVAGYMHILFSFDCYLFILKENFCAMCFDLEVLAALVVLMGGDLLFQCGARKGW